MAVSLVTLSTGVVTFLLNLPTGNRLLPTAGGLGQSGLSESRPVFRCHRKGLYRRQADVGEVARRPSTWTTRRIYKPVGLDQTAPNDFAA